MLFSWLDEKLFRSNKVLTIDLRTMRPTMGTTRFYTDLATTTMSHQWISSISADYDDHRPQIIPTATPIPTTISTAAHAVSHNYAHLIEIWSTFVVPLMQKNQQDFRFTLLFGWIFLLIGIMIMFSIIKLLNYLSRNCSLKSQRFSTNISAEITVQFQ